MQRRQSTADYAAAKEALLTKVVQPRLFVATSPLPPPSSGITLSSQDVQSFVMPADAHSETVLALSSDIQATNDVLELINPLDEAEQRAFVEISKRQFLAQYQLHRVTQRHLEEEQSSGLATPGARTGSQPSASPTAPSPAIPQQPAGQTRQEMIAGMVAQLRREFPEVAVEHIQFNLEAAQYDLGTARELLKA